MKKIFLALVFCYVAFGFDAILDDVDEQRGVFVVNKASYLALGKACEGWKQGDKLQIIRGEKNARCLTSLIRNLRTNTECELLCDAR